VYIVEIATTTGQVCESYATYEEARHRVDLFPADALAGIPFIFQELPDGSQRLVRDDGKPLQIHRLPDDRLAAGPDEPLPLADNFPPLTLKPPDCYAEPDEPLPLAEDFPTPGDKEM
jgi:hypothetical protein